MEENARDQLVDRLATAVEAFEDRLDMLQENLAILATRVGLGARLPHKAQPTPQTLDAWVSWLIDHYGLQDAIPTCWSQHPAISEELQALKAAWAGANDPVDGRPPDALLWHEALQRCLERIRAWDRAKCRTRGHTA